MTTEEVRTIKLEFVGEEVERIKSTIKKIHLETSSIGFNKTELSADEIKMIRDLNQKLNP